MTGKRPKSERSMRKSIIELGVIVVVALGLAVGIQAWVAKPFKIPSGSMEPTLAIGQRVIVNRLSTHFHSPKVGDILVFHPPVGSDEGRCGSTVRKAGQPCLAPAEDRQSKQYVKRVVGEPGDTLSIVDGHVIRNGKREQDSYIRPCDDEAAADCDFPTPFKVPAGHYFMMGDNRGNSEDSRFWGPIPKEWIIGGAFMTYWPAGRIGFM